ncbi:hypothetical protein AMJ48_02265 [Parcubacteria bacterium DG_74_1]|nr:MAG: hypothetical protein AMJ48_02265 [Parcubacteria bacterium DG_74_1]
MPKGQVTEQEIEKLKGVPGQVAGATFLIHLEYIKAKKGEKAVKSLEEKLKNWGYPIKYERIKPAQWYPIGLYASHLLAIKEVFNWGDKEIFNLGYSVSEYSPVVKTLIKYLRFLKAAPISVFKLGYIYWKKHYTIGELEVYPNDKEKRVTFQVRNFKIHPVICVFLAGYFLRLTQYIQRSEKFSVEETKCTFKGGPYHEYVIRWE